MESRKTYKAMTLVEILLYLALFSIIITVMVEFFVFVTNKNLDAKYRIEQSRNLILISETLEYWKSKTNSIDYAGSILNSDSGKLVFNTIDSTYAISNEGGILYFDDGVKTRLSVPHLNIQSFFLTPILNDKDGQIGVKIHIQMRYNLGNIDTESFDFIFKTGI